MRLNSSLRASTVEQAEPAVSDGGRQGLRPARRSTQCLASAADSGRVRRIADHPGLDPEREREQREDLPAAPRGLIRAGFVAIPAPGLSHGIIVQALDSSAGAIDVEGTTARAWLPLALSRRPQLSHHRHEPAEVRSRQPRSPRTMTFAPGSGIFQARGSVPGMSSLGSSDPSPSTATCKESWWHARSDRRPSAPGRASTESASGCDRGSPGSTGPISSRAGEAF